MYFYFVMLFIVLSCFVSFLLACFFLVRLSTEHDKIIQGDRSYEGKELLSIILDNICGIVFIQNYKGDINVSNCGFYNNGECNSCNIICKMNDEEFMIDENKSWLFSRQIDKGEILKANNCKYGFENIFLQRKYIVQQPNSKGIILNFIFDKGLVENS